MLPKVDNILLEQDQDTLTIWFNRPEVRNALSAEVTDDLAAVLEAGSSRAVRHSQRGNEIVSVGRDRVARVGTAPEHGSDQRQNGTPAGGSRPRTRSNLQAGESRARK